MVTLPGIITTAPDKTREPLACADGLELSVQAGPSSHCLDARGLDRHKCWDGNLRQYVQHLPFSAVEVGIHHPNPGVPAAWGQYKEDLGPDVSIDIYNFVPVEMVRELIDAHGGEAK